MYKIKIKYDLYKTAQKNENLKSLKFGLSRFSIFLEPKS